MISGNDRHQMLDIRKMTFFLCALIIGAVIMIFLGYIFIAYNPSAWLTENTNPVVFTVLMALLPIAGIPISIFLVLVGMIFGIPLGIAVTGILILFHMTVTYYLVHSLFRPLVLRLLNRSHISVPWLPNRGNKRLAFIFMLIPGLPYAIKNYLLVLSGIPFLPYIIISWLAQFVLSLPFIMLGRAVMKMDPVILAVAISTILLGFGGQNYLRRRYRKPIK
ncbi:MAG: TVP38/TMEM64 family protein [Desulfobulbales bacterium]